MPYIKYLIYTIYIVIYINIVYMQYIYELNQIHQLLIELCTIEIMQTNLSNRTTIDALYKRLPMC